MIQKMKNQNKKYKAFTLIEMVIVLIIMWIMLMATLYLSWDQIQRVRDKTVKESILAEMQSRYSRNLGSSSFVWIMYDTLDVTLSKWENKIGFKYNATDGTTGVDNTFMDNFKIEYITADYNFEQSTEAQSVENIKLQYSPYKISCKILKWDDEKDNVVIVTRVNNSRYYCFEIKQKNCRLIEVSEPKCEYLKIKTWVF
jgi:type II secretory pathway pseudopilin PulG